MGTWPGMTGVPDNFLSPSHTTPAPMVSTPAMKPSFGLSCHRPFALAVISSRGVGTQLGLLTFKALHVAFTNRKDLTITGIPSSYAF